MDDPQRDAGRSPMTRRFAASPPINEDHMFAATNHFHSRVRSAMPSLKLWPALSALVLSAAGCSALGTSQSTTHLSAAQCSDLTAIRNNAPPTRAQNLSELAALRAAGYDPSRWFDPNYPSDLQAAQRKVDLWYKAECQQARAQ